MQLLYWYIKKYILPDTKWAICINIYGLGKSVDTINQLDTIGVSTNNVWALVHENETAGAKLHKDKFKINRGVHQVDIIVLKLLRTYV